MASPLILGQVVGAAAGSLSLGAELVGGRKLARQLDRGSKAMRRAMRKRVKKAARIVQAEARRRVQRRTGRLRRAITFSTSVRSATEFDAEIGVEKTKAWYGHLVEGGTKPGRRGNRRTGQRLATSTTGRKLVGGRGGGTRAFPFMRPAAEATEDRVIAEVGLAFRPVLTGRTA